MVEDFIPPRSTLLIESGKSGSHLFVVLTEPCKFRKQILVGFTSITGSNSDDLTCKIDVGDHEFIDHSTYVRYRDARHEFSSHLINCRFPKHKIVSEALYRRICNGVFISEFSRPFIVRCMEGRCAG